MLTHGNTTLYTLLIQQADRYKEKSFILYEDQDISYNSMRKQVNQTGRWLASKGIKKGDTVAVFLSNSPKFYELWYACGAIGAVLLPINTASTPHELEYFLDHSESVAFIYEEELLNEEHIAIAEKAGLLFIQLCDTHWLEERRTESTDNLECVADIHDVACIMYTSGTTAKPKGVQITHDNYLFAGYTSVLYQQLTPKDRYLIFLPLFHANSQYYTSMATLVVGGTIVLLKKFSSGSFWDDVQRYQPTVTSLVATVIKMLLQRPAHLYEKEHTLRQAGYGLFVPKSDLTNFQSRFGMKLFQWYGMTESITTNIVTPLHEEMPVDPVTEIVAIGKAGVGNEIRIVNEKGEDVELGDVGEILVKSPSLMKGYFKNPEATADTIRDGWLYTGDNGYVNEEGFIWFVDRDKDMIKRAGENISSIEVENVLSEHPAIHDCAVIGEPDVLREEAVVAYVQLREGAEADSDMLLTFCKERLSYFKVPQEFRFVDDFPRTSIGKIQKNVLRKK